MQTLFGMRAPDDLYYTIKNYVKEEENYEDVWATLFEEADSEEDQKEDSEKEKGSKK